MKIYPFNNKLCITYKSSTICHLYHHTFIEPWLEDISAIIFSHCILQTFINKQRVHIKLKEHTKIMIFLKKTSWVHYYNKNLAGQHFQHSLNLDGQSGPWEGRQHIWINVINKSNDDLYWVYAVTDQGYG